MNNAIKFVLLTALVPAAQHCFGQNDSHDYFLNGTDVRSETATDIVPDYDLFYTPMTSNADIFGTMSEFNFSTVRYNRRGLSSFYSKTYFGNLDLSSLVTGAPDYGITGNLRRAGISRNNPSTLLSYGHSPGIRDTEYYSGEIKAMLAPVKSLNISAYDRRGRMGVKVTLAGGAGDKSDYLFWASRRWGKDPHVGGVFTDETSWLFSFDREIARGHKLTFFTTGSVAENGLRSYSVREAFALTGNNLYNPSWGNYRDKKRNSKVARKLQPFSVISYSGAAGAKSRISASVSFRFGRDAYSALSWFDADNPYPDYYRYMPGYSANSQVFEELSERWKRKDANIVQINWTDLYQQNSMSPDETVYLLEDRTRRVNDLQFAFSGETVFDRNLKINYGFRLRRDDSRFYKTVRSLLAGEEFTDRDAFLSGDEMFAGMVHNNLKNPDRKIGNGDRFGYDYTMLRLRAELFAGINYSRGRFRTSASVNISEDKTFRDGHYEKENFPGDLSYGKSEPVSMTNYALKVSAGYALSPSHHLEAALDMSSISPVPGALFLSPYYSNTAVENPLPVKALSAQAGYSSTMRKTRLSLTGFYIRTSDEKSVYRYWDDLFAEYSVMVLSGIKKSIYGIEAGMEVDITNRLTFRAGASFGRYSYISNPEAAILSDATHRYNIKNSVSCMKGYRLGTSPQSAASGELRYSNRGWLGALTVNYTGGRYVEPTPLRRMERVYGMADSPEAFRDMVKQEKLPDSFTTDIFLLKSFRLKKAGTLTAMVSINNLLNKRDIIYNAYEQMRIMRKGSGINTVYTPFPSKLLYSYGRTFYISMTYRY